LDVVVCDGFTGNIVLKSLEGLFDIMRPTVEQTLAKAAGEFTPTIPTALDTIHEHIDPMFDFFSPHGTGAAMLLGTRGVSVISHGSAPPETISNAIRTAAGFANDDLVGHLAEAVRVSP